MESAGISRLQSEAPALDVDRNITSAKTLQHTQVHHVQNSLRVVAAYRSTEVEHITDTATHVSA